MTDLILHHYDLSPYGRKVRAILGWKGLAWRSHEVAMHPPRPALASLAGGYRRIPVLQSGADIFCDSTLIAWVLDQMFPAKPILRAGDLLSGPAANWFEPRMFTIFSATRFRTREDFGGAFASEAEMAAFRADRVGFMAPLHDITQNAAFAATAAAHVRAHGQWIEGLLEDGRAFLQGEQPSLADFSLWHSFHWLKGRSAEQEVLQGLPRLWGWVDRIAAFGEGVRTPARGEDALAAAREAAPTLVLPHAPLPGDPDPGTTVRVAPTDYGLDPTEGALVSISVDHISVRRETPETGLVHLHFPRWGFRVDAAS